MVRWYRDAAIWLLLLDALSVLARNPGFKARITSKGLEYANDVAIQALTKEVRALRIPDQNGKSSGFRYWITNIHVTSFTPPVSTIRIDPGHGLTWSALNAYIAVHGDFRYKKWFIRSSGSFDAKVSGVTFSIGIDIGKDANGRPTIASRSCSSSIRDVDFKFHGGMAWLYNLFRRRVGRMIRDRLNREMCTLVNKAVNEDARRELAKLKVTTPLAKKFLLDYRLIQAPRFQTQYLEIYNKGEIFWLSDPTIGSPIVAPAIPNNTNTGKMLYLWVSDYMFDTFAYQAQKHGFLRYTMTQKDLPRNKGVLNTTCEGFLPKCIGNLIPEIGQRYPHYVVDLRMYTTNAPTMKITPTGVNITFIGVIDLYARKPGIPATKFLMSLTATMSTAVYVWIRNELLYARIIDLDLNLKVRRSAVGNISVEFLNFLINQALKLYLIPQLNDLGRKGFPLPLTDGIKFQNTDISFEQDSLMISTDLKYIPSYADMVAYTQDPLLYARKISHFQFARTVRNQY